MSCALRYTAKARKYHRCDKCDHGIGIGDPYFYRQLEKDGKWKTIYKLCINCVGGICDNEMDHMFRVKQ